MVQKMKTDSIERVEARREVGKRVRRESILAAAERVVIARGYAEASMDQVAREAGMAAGTLYLYFPGKEALLQELLGSKVRRLDEAVGEEIEEGRGMGETVRAVVLAMFRHFEEHRGFFECFVREQIEFTRNATHSSGVLREMAQVTARLTEWIAGAQRRGEIGGGDAALLAVALRGLVFQFTRDWLRDGAKGELTRHAGFVAAFFLKGARA